MKILLCSHVFPPSIGGTETVGKLLAQEFASLGHEVRVVTETPGQSGSTPYQIYRRPSPAELFRHIRWADVVFHNNISLRVAWPMLLSPKPWFITHHTWLVDRAKSFISRYAQNISISHGIAASLPFPSRVIPDPYDANLFFLRRDIPRERDLLFVGRLVSDKGCDLLLDALELIDTTPSVTIVGDGPDRAKLQQRAGPNVHFTGSLQGEALARCYNQHRVLVVPSRWNEPFGIVALEAIACGCSVIGSSGGGLPEAIGPCGTVFENANVAALAEALRNAQIAPNGAEVHLKKHYPSEVARQYLDFFRNNQ